ncbi:MAG: hypothetical protein LBC33_00215, partial [Mycoplasmataceae bacterium]|nr:hypothetical protein [Mycoplasmataceae bacterium]
MRKFKNHSPENQQSDIGLNCTTKHVKRNRFYSWTKLHTLLVIFGTLIIFSGFGSLIYYFAVNAQNAIRNQDYNERFIPNEKNITPQRVKNINDSIDGLLACWENNERNIDLASAFGDELKKINENADLSDYEKYIAINETAYAYDVELIDPYLVTEMLCAKKADLVNQVANLNLSVDETNKVKEVLADKIDDYEELIGKEIFTIDDLNEQVAEDKYAALDAIKSSDESWIAENQMLESFSQSYFIDLFNNYGNKISAIKDEDAVEGISAGSVTQVIQHSNTNVTPLQITWDQLFTENNVNQYVGLVDETGQPLFTTATYAFVFPYIGIDNQLISLDLLADELIDFTDYEITAHIQAFDCDEISSESYNHNNYYDYDFSIAFALQTIAKDEFDQPRWTGEPTPYYTIQLNPSDEYERKNNAAIFEQLDFEYNINSTFDV